MPHCRISVCPHYKIAAYPENPHFRNRSGCPGFRISISGFPHIRMPGFPEIRASGFPEMTEVIMPNLLDSDDHIMCQRPRNLRCKGIFMRTPTKLTRHGKYPADLSRKFYPPSRVSNLSVQTSSAFQYSKTYWITVENARPPHSAATLACVPERRYNSSHDGTAENRRTREALFRPLARSRLGIVGGPGMDCGDDASVLDLLHIADGGRGG